MTTHLKGTIRPFALCGSFTAVQPHLRDVASVNCPACAQRYHEAARDADPEHDRGGCWCCCTDCPWAGGDLTDNMLHQENRNGDGIG